jgi:hypothetical protein
MEQELQKKIEEQGLKIDAIYKSVEKTRKYFLVTIWITVIAVVIPIIGLIIAIPLFMNTYINSLGGMTSGGSTNTTDILNSIKDLGL